MSSTFTELERHGTEKEVQDVYRFVSLFVKGGYYPSVSLSTT